MPIPTRAAAPQSPLKSRTGSRDRSALPRRTGNPTPGQMVKPNAPRNEPPPLTRGLNRPGQPVAARQRPPLPSRQVAAQARTQALKARQRQDLMTRIATTPDDSAKRSLERHRRPKLPVRQVSQPGTRELKPGLGSPLATRSGRTALASRPDAVGRGQNREREGLVVASSRPRGGETAEAIANLLAAQARAQKPPQLPPQPSVRAVKTVTPHRYTLKVGEKE